MWQRSSRGEDPVPFLGEPDSTDPNKQAICCPICGVWLDEIGLARPDEESFCPWCCTQQKPGAVSEAGDSQ